MLTTLCCSQLPAMVCNSLLIFVMYMVRNGIKFNPLNSQVITFGGQNPCCQIMLNSNQILWVNKVLVFTFAVILALQIYQIFAKSFMDSLIVFYLCFVNAQMKWLLCIWQKLTVYLLSCMDVKPGHWLITVCTPSALHGTTVFGIFLSVAGVRALNLFSFSAKQCQLRT